MLALNVADAWHYFEVMVSPDPPGIIPKLLELNDDDLYADMVDVFYTEIRILGK